MEKTFGYPEDNDYKLTDDVIEFFRYRISIARLYSQWLLVKQQGREWDDEKDWPEVGHIWFPKDSSDEREFRLGNAPSNSDRPKWLKNKDLWIDCKRLPKGDIDHILSGDAEDFIQNEQERVKSQVGRNPFQLIKPDPIVINTLNKTRNK